MKIRKKEPIVLFCEGTNLVSIPVESGSGRVLAEALGSFCKGKDVSIVINPEVLKGEDHIELRFPNCLTKDEFKEIEKQILELAA